MDIIEKALNVDFFNSFVLLHSRLSSQFYTVLYLRNKESYLEYHEMINCNNDRTRKLTSQEGPRYDN